MLNTKTRVTICTTALILVLMASPMALSASSYSSKGMTTIASSGLALSPAPLIYGIAPYVGCGDVHALCPSMLTTAYDMSTMQGKGINGSGQAVVIDDACGDPNIASDLKTFDLQFGLSNPTLNIFKPQGTPCTNSGWSLETSLDVEWAHVVAPGATINLVESAQPNNDLYKSWNYSVTNHLGSEISNSWGGSGNCPSIARQALLGATAAGVTILASAGDSGAWGQNHGGNSQPADCLQILAIGGTTLNVQSTGKYISESAWSSSGGGYVIGTHEPKFESKANITDSFKELAKRSEERRVGKE